MFKFTKIKKLLQSCIHVLHKPLNSIISRCRLPEDTKETKQQFTAPVLTSRFVLWRFPCRQCHGNRRSLFASVHGNIIDFVSKFLLRPCSPLRFFHDVGKCSRLNIDEITSNKILNITRSLVLRTVWIIFLCVNISLTLIKKRFPASPSSLHVVWSKCNGVFGFSEVMTMQDFTFSVRYVTLLIRDCLVWQTLFQ